MANTQIRITPLGEAQSLKSKAYEALRTAILNMNIYDHNAELRLDERQLSAQLVSVELRCGKRWPSSIRRGSSASLRGAASISCARPRPRSWK
jgi:hypothetical protein